MAMLFEAALRNVRTGVARLEAGRGVEGSDLLIRASEILVELHATLDRAQDPELCDTLGEIYRFACARLSKAALARDPESAREAERVLAPVAEAFIQAVEHVGPGVAGGAR